MPDEHDASGTIFLLDQARGTLMHTYAIAMPPQAADASHDRLYLAGAGTVHGLSLRSGVREAVASGDAPLAASSALGLVAFVRRNHVVVARWGALQTVFELKVSDLGAPSALAWQGRYLVIGTTKGAIARMKVL